MKIKKLLIPVLSTIGTITACTPLICLTSCGEEATTKELFTIGVNKEKTVDIVRTAEWEFFVDTINSVAVPSDAKATIFVTSESSNCKFQQCTSTISGTSLDVKVGYTTSSEGLTKSQDVVSTFKLVINWTESGKSFTQTIDGFKLIYKFTKA